MRLDDGTIIPSHLKSSNFDANQHIRNDSPLRTGIITSVFYTDDPNNISKRFIEYNVDVTSSHSNGSVNTITYRNCRHLDIFGAINKHENFVLETSTPDGKSQGSKCLILCIDGINASGGAIIIGGLQDGDLTPWKRSDGQFYDFSYNGIDININKDGEYTLTFNSYIDQKGKKANEKAAGTVIKIDKNGNYSLSNNEDQSIKVDRSEQQITIKDPENSILIDKKNKKIDLKSSGDISETATKSISQMAKDYKLTTNSIAEKALGSVSIQAGTSIKEKAGSSWEVEAGANVNIKSGANVSIEGGGIAKLKGTVTMVGQGTTPIALVGSMVVGTSPTGPVIGIVISGSTDVLGS